MSATLEGHARTLTPPVLGAREPAQWASWARRSGAAALCATPACLTVYLAFNSGGYFAGSQGVALAVLAGVIAVRMVVVRAPFEGFTRAGIAATAGLAGYAALSLLSSHWSHSPSRALLSFETAALYLCAVVLFGSATRSHRRVRWTTGLVGAAVVAVCLASLATRLRPDLFPIPVAMSPERLAFPLTYWNALGAFAAVGLVLALHFASSRQGPPFLRIAGATVSPVLAVTILLTYSRAAVLLAIFGVAAYLVLARPRGVVGALLAGAPACGVALLTAYHAGALTNAVSSPAAAVEGRHLTLVLAITCAAAGAIRAALLGLDTSLGSVTLADPVRRRIRRSLGWGSVALTIVVAVAFHHQIASQWSNFVRADSNANDVRNRIDSFRIGGRLEGWRIAVRSFDRSPFTGSGAGTFELAWDRYRSSSSTATQTHSVYLQALGELGIVGELTLVLGIGALLLAVFRSRRRSRSLWSAIAIVLALWAVHAAVDWDWQMPALTLPIVCLAASACSRRGAAKRMGARAELGLRLIVAAVTVGLVVVGVSLAVSDSSLAASVADFNSGACPLATQEALVSSGAIVTRPQPYAIRGYCDIQLNRASAAIPLMSEAIALDPRNWRYRYGLAISEAAAGRNPWPALRAARELDPRESLITDAMSSLAHTTPARRGATIRSLATPVSMRQ